MRILQGAVTFVLAAAIMWAAAGEAAAQSAPVRQETVGLRTSFAPVVKQTSKAVVNIYSEKVVVERAVNPLTADPMFQYFFGNAAAGGGMRQKLERSLGSGVILSKEGFVVTNFHVVQGAQRLKVGTADGKELSAKVIGGDEALDLAVLKLEGKGPYAYVPFGDSDTLSVGDVVLAVGNPFGIGQSVSMGIVSALGRNLGGQGGLENFIQTDAAVNPGNSGGALIDSAGKLVGINTAIYSKSGGYQGISFAIPSNDVKTILLNLASTGKVEHSWLGATGQNITPALASGLGLERAAGVLVNDVTPNSPAEQADVRVGDVIVTADNKPVANLQALSAKLSVLPVGQEVQLGVWRGGETVQIPVRMAPQPVRKAADRITLGGYSPLAGYVFEQLSVALNGELGLPSATQGVAVVGLPQEMQQRGMAAGMMLRPGDVLVSLNGKPVPTLAELKALTERRPEKWVITYQRGRATGRLVLR